MPNGYTESYFGQQYMRVPTLLHPCRFWYYRILLFSQPDGYRSYKRETTPVSIQSLLSTVLDTLQTRRQSHCPRVEQAMSRRNTDDGECNVRGTGAAGKKQAGERGRERRSGCFSLPTDFPGQSCPQEHQQEHLIVVGAGASRSEPDGRIPTAEPGTPAAEPPRCRLLGEPPAEPHPPSNFSPLIRCW